MTVSSRFSWDLHRVREVLALTSNDIAEMGAWLWLDGARLHEPDTGLSTLIKDFSSTWVWRNTHWEYAGAGYRAGPLVTPLTAAALESFNSIWAVQGIGMILLTPAPRAELAAHLQRLRSIDTADGERLGFNLGDTRRLEELGEGLCPATLARLLGPLDAVLWPDMAHGKLSWRQLDNPMPGVMDIGDGVALLVEDEAGLTHARRQAYLRHAAAGFTVAYPKHVASLGDEGLERQLIAFASEADALDITREADAIRYLGLRLRYPQAPFETDTVLRAHLTDLRIDARQRVFELEHRLRTTHSIASP